MIRSTTMIFHSILCIFIFVLIWNINTSIAFNLNRKIPIVQQRRHTVILSPKTSITSSSSSPIASSSPPSSSSKLLLFPDPEIWPQCIEGASINLVLGTLLLFTKQKSLTRYYYQYITIHINNNYL